MKRVFWAPIIGVKEGEEHTCGNCWFSMFHKGSEKDAPCKHAKVIYGEGTATVISPCSGQLFTYPEEVIIAKGEN